ncbi:MAG: XdhC/CoxI family protein [Thermosphaera sp.]
MRVEEILSKAIEELNKGRPVAIAVITGKEGSGPREIGATMVVTVDGEKIGTIGGGELESLIVKNAIEALQSGNPKKIRLALRRENIPPDAQPTGMLCGGVVEVFINVLKPRPRIIILGAGNVGKPLADIANILGYRVVVMDKDESLANTIRYPYAEYVFAGDFISEVGKIESSPNDVFAVVYGEVETDYQALKKVIQNHPGRHIWVLCSRHRAKWMEERLVQEGVSVESLKNYIHMPAGLDINSSTPEEIAISIWSEIICVMKNCSIPVGSLNILSNQRRE